MEPTSKFEDKSKDVRLEKFVISASGMIPEKNYCYSTKGIADFGGDQGEARDLQSYYGRGQENKGS